MPSAFRTSLPADELTEFTGRLVEHLVPDGRRVPASLASAVPEALERVEHCFSRIHRKYYDVDGQTAFDHLNGDHLATFLYLLGNSVWRSTGETELPTKLFMVNKALHGLDLFYAVTMPEVFLLVHPVGTVIGNASYSDYLVIYQGCTVGADKGVYPTFSEDVVMYSRSSVLGASRIGSNVVLAANSFVVNADVPDDSLVVGQFPSHRVLPNPETVRTRIFDPAGSAP